MRGTTLLLVGLLSLISLTSAGILGWLEGEGKEERSRADIPQGDEPRGDSVERQVHSLLEAVKGSFSEMASKRSSWYDRYDGLARQATNNSAMIHQLMGFSRTAMPIVWTTFTAEHMANRRRTLKYGEEVMYKIQTRSTPVPHPLRSLTTKLTPEDDFAVEAILKLNAEANVGIRLMFEPEAGQTFNWDNDDIFLGIHLRWYFDYGPDREISLHDKYHGSFRHDQEVILPREEWPNIQVGEKFAVYITKEDNCFYVEIALGKDLYIQEQPASRKLHAFCPQPLRTSKMLTDPKRLRLVINEDRPHRGQVEVHKLSWYPRPRDDRFILATKPLVV